MAFLSFGCHIAAALGILWYDSPRSTTLNKLKLLEVTITSSACFARALHHAFAGRRRAHRQWMVTCFILSIEGAGTIRTVWHAAHRGPPCSRDATARISQSPGCWVPTCCARLPAQDAGASERDS